MNTEYRKLKNLFLRQSCQDAWEDYARSIRKVNFPRWDYVILTSSNEEQARSFRSQIADRLEQGVLPGWTKYFVLPDPEGKRVGSGGATLNVLRFLSEEEGLRGDFHNKRILVIHSGGDSKRVPQYSVCGKLFHLYQENFRMEEVLHCLMNFSSAWQAFRPGSKKECWYFPGMCSSFLILYR